MRSNEIILKGIANKTFSRIIENDSWEDILNSIFYININSYKKDMINIIDESLSIAFGIDGHEFITVIIVGSLNFKKEDFDSKFYDLIRTINVLKAKYKSILMKEIDNLRNPLGLQSIGSNVGQSMTNHTINIVRNDGERLNLNCTLQDTINFNISINRLTRTILEVGTYNIDIELARRLIQSNNELLDKIISMMPQKDK